MIFELPYEQIDLLADCILVKMAQLRNSTKGLYISKDLREAIEKEINQLQKIHHYLLDQLTHTKITKE